MRRATDSWTELRTDAARGVDGFLEFLRAGRLLGMAVPDDAQVRAGLAAIDRFDVAALAADSRCLAAAHRAAAEHLHRLPEQQIRLDRGWRGTASADAIVAVIEHQRRAESDLHVLRTLSEATSAAAAGIDRLLRSCYLAIGRVAAPSATGLPAVELPAAVAVGRVPLSVVMADITSRVELFGAAVDSTTHGIGEILTLLNRATDGLDTDPYPGDPVPTPADIRILPSRAALAQVVSDLDEHSASAPSVAGSDWTAEGRTDHTDLPENATSPTAIAPTPGEAMADTEAGNDADVPFRLGAAPGRTAPAAEAATTDTEGEQTPGTTSGPAEVDAGPRGDRESSGELALAGDQ